MGGGGAMSAVRTLVDLLAGRRDAQDLAPRDWDGVIGAARAEALLATLAHRLASAPPPRSRGRRRCGRPRWRAARSRPKGSRSCC
jgi:hypothetical protein